ncbi:CDP-alcohol phosphatidyltransferase family protein [Patescibacteria group bacterium]|nr:CDP-alcohol phosphatidyltransferase family protein [Patescibacteria group bacterium]
MFEFIPQVNKKFGRWILPMVSFLHLKLKLTPNQLSVIGAGFGLVAFVLVLLKYIGWGLIFLFITEFIDVLDGAMARRFKLESKTGEKLELYIDRGHEFLMFLAFVIIGEVEVITFILVYTAIILMTLLKSRSKFDPDFKRKSLFVGYFVGFNLILQFVFLINLVGFMISLVIIDYKEDKKLLPQIKTIGKV